MFDLLFFGLPTSLPAGCSRSDHQLHTDTISLAKIGFPVICDCSPRPSSLNLNGLKILTAWTRPKSETSHCAMSPHKWGLVPRGGLYGFDSDHMISVDELTTEKWRSCRWKGKRLNRDPEDEVQGCHFNCHWRRGGMIASVSVGSGQCGTWTMATQTSAFKQWGRL